MSYEIIDTDSCLATIINGGKGMITNISCLKVVEPGDMVTVSIEYTNEGNTTESFALLFCASTEPHTECNIISYVSNAFVLFAGESGVNYRQFVMPEKAIAYVAELQRWDIGQNKWVSDDSKSCTINIPEEPTDILKYVLPVGLGVGLLMMMKK